MQESEFYFGFAPRVQCCFPSSMQRLALPPEFSFRALLALVASFVSATLRSLGLHARVSLCARETWGQQQGLGLETKLREINSLIPLSLSLFVGSFAERA